MDRQQMNCSHLPTGSRSNALSLDFKLTSVFARQALHQHKVKALIGWLARYGSARSWVPWS